MASTGTGAPGSAASHPYTCNSCQVVYRSSDLQKTHMKSDWHRYNLKRRVASLPPIASEAFTEKVLRARTATAEEADKALFERLCEACAKVYYSENAYQNHLLSQRHKQNLAAASQQRHDDETTSVASSTFSLGEPTAVAADHVDSDVENEFNQVIESLQKAAVTPQRPSPVKRPSNPYAVVAAAHHGSGSNEEAEPTAGPGPVWTLTSCVFCNYASPTVPHNVSHMERFHGMFIPEKSYLIDLEGLVKHLQRQVGQDRECLSCGKIKTTVFAVQTHMRDKGHCKIPYGTEEEQLRIGDFYDFRSTYSDEESDSEATEEEQGGARLKAKSQTQLLGSDGQEMDEGEPGDGWETDSSLSSLDSANLTAFPAEGRIQQFERLSKHPHHSHHDSRHRHQADGWHSRAHKHTHAVFHDDYELHLPSGKSVGHRSLNRYFRQNLARYPSAEERGEDEGLAIEGAASDREGGLAEGNRQLAVRNRRGRELLPGGAADMLCVSDDKRRMARRAQQRGRDVESLESKRNAWSYGKRANNQKTYYYRYEGGG